MADLGHRLFLPSAQKAQPMIITLHVEMPGNRGYSLRFTDARRAARAYSAELRTPGATISVDIGFDR